jgi:hypothetical protein
MGSLVEAFRSRFALSVKFLSYNQEEIKKWEIEILKSMHYQLLVCDMDKFVTLLKPDETGYKNLKKLYQTIDYNKFYIGSITYPCLISCYQKIID